MSEKDTSSGHLNRKKRSEKQYKRVENSDESKLGHYMLPNDTRKIIEKKIDVIDIIDNYSLKLNKVSYFDSKNRSYGNDKDEKFKFFEVQKGKVILNVKPNFSGINFLALVERHRNSLQNLGLKIKQSIYKTEWKIAVGLGNESVYETSITLHHIYGIPYIPGSSIKGVIRSHIILEKFGKDKYGNLDLKNAENRALSDQGFCDIFGCPKNSFYKESRQGKIIFFDAFPLSEPKVEPEIMNSHFDPYYSDNSNKTPPADYHDPKPIFFLVVKDTEFEFTVGLKETNNTSIQTGIFREDRPLSVAYSWMQKALKEHGVGAKTSVGYGYFEGI